MELHPSQTGRSNGGHNLVETCVHENAILLYLAGQFFRDLANQFSLDLPWTWSKDESHCMRATFRCETRIFKAGIAAYLDPHGGLSLAHWRAFGSGREQRLERLAGIMLAH